MSNDFHNFELFVKRASFLSIRNAVRNELKEREKYAAKNELSQSEVEILWQLRDFLEIYGILKSSHSHIVTD